MFDLTFIPKAEFFLSTDLSLLMYVRLMRPLCSGPLDLIYPELEPDCVGPGDVRPSRFSFAFAGRSQARWVLYL